MKKVPTIEVKRCFVISDFVRIPKAHRRFLGAVTQKELARRISAAKKKVLRRPEAELNRLVSPNWPGRLRAYEACDWYIRTFKITQLGVWKRASKLPLAWTKKSLAHTAREVKQALADNSKVLTSRARHSLPSMLALDPNQLQKEKYLLPIVFKAGTGTRGRKGLSYKLKGDIDDGCMRSIALAVSGKKNIKVYFGVPKLALSKR